MLSQIAQGLVVSCQALEDEPLHSSFIMGRLALAAKEGGAVGIRANSVKDIAEIKRVTDLPVIGIIKRDYSNSDVYITPTIGEVLELCSVGVDMIAMDATERCRPDEDLKYMVSYVKQNFPNIKLMADIATLEQALTAQSLGFDCISSTLRGYTKDTYGMKNTDDDYLFIRDLLENITIPVIAEGNISTPSEAKYCLYLGCHAVVVGGAITRPQNITKTFVNKMKCN